MHTKSFLLFILVIIASLVGNLLIVTTNVSSRLREDLHAQLYTLAYESGQMLDANSSLIENLVANMEQELKGKNVNAENLETSFVKYTAKTKRYTVSNIFLTDKNHKIITSSEFSKAYGAHKAIDLSQREYLQQTVKIPEEMHIGDLVRGAVSKTWSIPIAKAIVDEAGRYVGAVVISIPLSRFSESVFSSHVDLSTIAIIPKERVEGELVQDSDGDRSNIDEAISRVFIIKAATLPAFMLNIEGNVANLRSEVIFAITSTSVSGLFWKEYIDHSLISFCLLICIIAALIWFKRRVIAPINDINEKINFTAQNLSRLVPDYRLQGVISYDGVRKIDYESSLKAIEGFVAESDVVMEALIKQKEMIRARDNHLSILQRNFAACMKSLQESANCLSENIDDLILHNKSLSKAESGKALVQTLEQTYDYTGRHKKHISSLKKTIEEAMAITQKTKARLDLDALVQKNSPQDFEDVIINKSGFDLVTRSRVFYVEAIAKAIQSLFDAFEDKEPLSLEIKEQSRELIIEAIYAIGQGKAEVDSKKLYSGLEKARIYALLDEGIVNIHTGSDKIVITIVYA